MNDETLFHLALDRPPAERAAFLAVACGSDAAQRQRVEALLAAHQNPGTFLGGPCPQSPVADLPGALEAIASSHDAAPNLGFLAPSSRPESLGRLGHYEILEVVGSGAFGVVLKALDEKLHRVVAIKVLAAALAASATARRRFIREAQAAAAVNHDNVVRIYAVESEGPVLYLVMEYVEGIALEARLKQTGPLELKEVLRIGLQIAEGLAAAHRQGLVHRDVKPGNILLENGIQRVKITDFGLAREAGAGGDDLSLSHEGMIAGTPSYMAPEQARGEAVDHRADLFSLGSVLYAMCSGHAPFRAASTLAVLKRVCEDRPSPIREANPDIPDWLVAIVEKLHAKEPADRIQTAAEVAKLLGERLAELQEPGRAPGVDRRAAGVSPLSTASPQGAYAPRSPWRRWTLVAAAVLGLLAAVGLTEATGVTQLAPSVIRIAVGEGTLVVEVDDPGVSIQIGGEALVIQGAGPHEVQLRVGPHELEALRDGTRLHQQTVSITRGGREVVKITHEPPSKRTADAPVGELRRLEGLSHEINGLAISPDGRRALVGDGWPVVAGQLTPGESDFRIRLYDLETGQEVWCSATHELPIRCVGFNQDGRRALTAARFLQPWDLEGRQELPASTVILPSGIRAAAFSRDGQVALTAGYDRVVRLWDLESGRLLGVFKGHTDAVGCVALSPDGRRIVAGCGGDHIDRKYVLPSGSTLRVWDVATGKELHTFGAYSAPVVSVAISPDSRYVLSGSGDREDCTARLWDIETGELVRVFAGHTDVVSSVAFTPDGRRILTGANDEATRTGDGTVRLWDVATGAELLRFAGHRGGVRRVAISPDGGYALSGGIVDGMVKFWRLPPADD